MPGMLCGHWTSSFHSPANYLHTPMGGGGGSTASSKIIKGDSTAGARIR